MRLHYLTAGLLWAFAAASAAAELPVERGALGTANQPGEKTDARDFSLANSPVHWQGDWHTLLPAQAALPGSIRRIVPLPGEKPIALTFDLCESARKRSGYDAAIVDYLKKNGIRATFYAGGKWMQSHPEETRQLLSEPLFEIGNHGWQHRNLRRSTLRQAQQEILWTQAEYAGLRQSVLDKAKQERQPPPDIAPIPATFRFPFGVCSAESLALLEQYRLPAVQWSIVTGDPAPHRTAKAIADTVLTQAKPGDIIVAHANGKGKHTAEALPLFIPTLLQQGFRFITVSELLHSASKIEAPASCYEQSLGDNLRYDKPTR